MHVRLNLVTMYDKTYENVTNTIAHRFPKKQKRSWYSVKFKWLLQKGIEGNQ